MKLVFVNIFHSLGVEILRYGIIAFKQFAFLKNWLQNCENQHSVVTNLVRIFYLFQMKHLHQTGDHDHLHPNHSKMQY